MDTIIVPTAREESTLGERYQAVFPKRVRQVAKKFKVGVKLYMMPIREDAVLVTSKPRNWVKETYGMFKGMWKGDATKMIRKLRDEEWE